MVSSKREAKSQSQGFINTPGCQSGVRPLPTSQCMTMLRGCQRSLVCLEINISPDWNGKKRLRTLE